MNQNCLSGKSLFLLLRLSLIIFFFLNSLSFAAAGPSLADTIIPPENSDYNLAKDYYYLLLRDPVVQTDRRNWLAGIRDFRRIYLNDPKGEAAPNCLFMMAKMYYRMYMHFKQAVDLDESIACYDKVWSLFPDNTLADDALFWSASIYLTDKKDPVRAAALYKDQITRYPEGDTSSRALSRLQEIESRHDIALPEKPGSLITPETLSQVLPIKYWSSNDYARIVIRSSDPVSYTSSLSDSADALPRRLYIDFRQSSVEGKHTAPVVIKEGLLQRIQSTQHDRATVRVDFDLESVSSYKIFSLNDPFRVIVDIHGQQQVIAAAKTLPRLSEEPLAGKAAVHRADSLPELQPAARKNTLNSLATLSREKESLVVLEERLKKKPGSRENPTLHEPQPGISLAQQLGLGVRRIVIDPGHGGKDPGAMAHGLKEKDIALKVAKMTAETLRTRYRYEVILTREDDIYLPLEERIAIANTKKADLFISIHVNAHPKESTSGIETFYLNLATNNEAMRVAARENATSAFNISDLQDILAELMQNAKITESSLLAEFVQNNLVRGLRQNSFPTRDLGVKQAPFYVLIGAKMPAVLAEISYISNPQDAEKLKKEHYLNEIAGQIAAGVAGYANHQATAALQL